MDNWTLEDSGELLSEGLRGDVASELRFSPDGQDYFYQDTNWDSIAFDCLAQLLSNIVLTDVCYVDSDNSHAWHPRFDRLVLLEKEGVIRQRSFRNQRDAWVPIREAIVDDLATAPAVRKQHEENTTAWQEGRDMPDDMLSQILHGGAGMMARARIAEMPYVSHPQRQALIERARFMAFSRSAQMRFSSLIQSSRVNLFERTDSDGFYAKLRLPPVAIRVINEATGIDDLLTTALHMRDRFADLRQWLSEFQHALDAEDVKEIRGRQKLLSELIRAIDGKTPDDVLGVSTVQLSVTEWLKVNLKPSALTTIRNRFGVRSQITRLLLTEPGLKAVRRFCGFFEQRQSLHALNLERDLQSRWGA